MRKSNPREEDLLKPVLRLFPKRTYRRFREVPLGRKKIDVWCVSKREEESEACIELKIRDWRTALWQAIINFQMAPKSYIAIWHKYAERVEKEATLLEQYGVGLISVGPKRAKIVIRSQPNGERSRGERKSILDENLVSV